MEAVVADPELERLLAGAERAVEAVAAHGALPVDGADAYRVVRRVEGLARRVAALQVGVVDEVDRRRLHVGDGHRSARALVGYAANLASAEAGRRSRSARALRDLPEVAAGLARGEVGRDQVDRIARVHANPRVRHQLGPIDHHLAVAAAQLTYDELDRHLSEWERLADEDGAGDRAERNHRRRDFTIRQNLDGSWRMAGGCGSLQGTVAADIFEHYVAAEREADWAEARGRLGDAATPADLVRNEAQRRMDAFAKALSDAAGHTAETAGHQITTDLVVDQATFERHVRRSCGDDPGPDDRVGTYWSDLARTTPDPGPDGRSQGSAVRVGVRCTTLDGRPIDPAEAVAATLVGHLRRVVLDAQGVTIDLGRRSRCFTGPARLAVQLSQTHCSWPGCHVPVHDCQADHLQPWGEGGTTDPGNGAPTCGKHNRHRNHGFTVGRDPTTGRLHVHRPDGTPIE